MYTLKRLQLFLLLFAFTTVYAQENTCKVVIAEISGSYTGQCKDGLAHGKGKATGVDSYEGRFLNGVPSGKGTYKWADGTRYEGLWKNGLRDGRGKMAYGDSVVTGYWKDDKYIGRKIVPSYSVTRSMSVTRYVIRKADNTGNGVRIRILRAGSDMPGISGLSIFTTSGDEYRTGAVYGIQNAQFPIEVKVSYRAWNTLGTAQFNVIFEFTINEPGLWDVNITN